MDSWDVIVVGAGPSGSTTALHLARAGAHVLLLDRAKFPRDKPCGGGVTVRAFARAPVDVSPVVEHVVDRLRFSFRLGPSFDYRYGRPLAYMTQRRRLDAFLLEHAVAAGAELRDGEPVRSLTIQNGGALADTAHGRLSARVLVGADGSNGVVARSVGLDPAPGPPVAIEACFAYAAGDGSCPPSWQGMLALELGSMDGGYGWAFPKSDHFNVGCGGFRNEGGRLRKHLAALAHHYAVDGNAVLKTQGHLLPTRVDGAPITKGPALLVGDAAGLIDPMSGEGLYAAFVSGELAAQACLRYLRGEDRGLSAYEDAVEHELMGEIRAAALIRDAYHFTPRPIYAVVKRWPRLRGGLCQLMTGERTYDDLLRRLGPLGRLTRVWAALGRRERARRLRAARA